MGKQLLPEQNARSLLRQLGNREGTRARGIRLNPEDFGGEFQCRGREKRVEREKKKETSSHIRPAVAVARIDLAVINSRWKSHSSPIRSRRQRGLSARAIDPFDPAALSLCLEPPRPSDSRNFHMYLVTISISIRAQVPFSPAYNGKFYRTRSISRPSCAAVAIGSSPRCQPSPSLFPRTAASPPSYSATPAGL